MRLNFIVVILFVFESHAFAQFAGLSSSSWAGVTSVTQNPAIADNKYKVDITLGGISISGNSNTGFAQGGLNLPGALFTNSATTNLLGGNSFVNDLNSNRTGSSFNSVQRTRLQGPLSFLFSFGKNNENAIAVTWNINYLNSVRGGSPQFYQYINNLQDSTSAPMADKKFTDQNINMTSLAWADFGITYSRVILDKNKHFFKAGATIKLIQGLGASSISTNNADITFINKYGTVGFNNVDFNYVRTNQANLGPNLGLGNGNASPTAGSDIGFVYEYRPKEFAHNYDMNGITDIKPKDVNLYFVAAGFSISDIGAIHFNPNGTSGNFALNGFYTLRNPETGSNVNFLSGNANQLDQFIDTAGHANIATKSFRIFLPMRINSFVDLNLDKGFGVNLNVMAYPQVSNSIMFVRDITTFTLTPRFDVKWFGAYLPLSVDVNKNINVGVSLRLGPVFFGFQNLLGWFGKVHNAEFHLAIHIPIPYAKPRDRDKDGVSDKIDKCPLVKGSLLTCGCPDRDSDGVYDQIDSCPDQPGLAKFNGCPDSDGDGIQDKQDSCPFEPGLAKNFGCPDRDSDGVIDKYDLCPDEPGTVKAHGCPDMDNDGIPDKEDSCPKQAGPIEFHGCPDRDGDGVPDKFDKCPDKRGAPEHHGCPDSDNDGVYDDEDSCIDTPGPKSNHGCPVATNDDIDPDRDTDGDGIPDVQDSCPHEFGYALYHGCTAPYHKKIKYWEEPVDEITFEKGSAVLTALGKESLNSITEDELKDLKSHSQSSQSFIIVLIGHADSTEGATISEKENLSQARIEAARDYLVDHKVPTAIINGDFVGDEAPKAPSNTELNRRKNRIVEVIKHFSR